MVRLLNQYQLLWSRLKNKAIDVDNATKILNINQSKLRVLLSRMRKEHMIVTTKRGEHHLAEPKKWIQINGFRASWRNLPIPDQLIEDLILHSEEIRAIVLYGSTVSGNTTPLSDVDILIISDKNLTELEDKYKFPISIEVQPTEGYDSIYVRNAVKKGEAVYDDGVLDRVRNSKTTREDYAKKLEEIRTSLFKLNDERLFESLTIMDVAHILYSSLRGLEIVEEEICGTIRGIEGIDQGILKGAKELYDLSKAGQRGVPDVTRNDLKTLRDAIIGKWVNLKIEVDR